MPAHASLTLLVGEPFGTFGTLVPVGHTAIYLNHLCADGPFALRECHPGEIQGVAIARYDRIGQYDWVASPIMQFLYAVDQPEDIPAYITPTLAKRMRENYRKRFLAGFVPDGKQREKRTREWWESAGVTFNRRLWGYTLETTPQQDLALMQHLNAAPNRHHYTFSHANCADFAVDIIDFYHLGAVPHHGDRLVDFGWMTPKFVARNLAQYGARHPEAGLKIIEIPQLPGSLQRSRPVRGGIESGLKTKRYLAAMFVMQPELPPALAVIYLIRGRWKLGDGAQTVAAESFAVCPSCEPLTTEVVRTEPTASSKSSSSE